ncbi:MAG: 16S rRNA (uracil(1498)-N(3))-methyltransferase [Clostridia bacterium]|nr:16S rRNA (uracil(1498)-N(3))-methyltransferase [Clostridia bacterium]
MPRFFVQPISDDHACVTGQDAHHIARVLRMREGEGLTLCDGMGTDYRCEIETIADGEVGVKVLERTSTESEPSVRVTLYQGLPKSEKMDWIIQKCVEIGVARVVPVAMARSIVRLKPDEGTKKQARWQKIAAEAACQSGRGCIPRVDAPVSLKQVIAQLEDTPAIVFYEGGGKPLAQLVNADMTELSIFIGPEGGFDVGEIEMLQESGVQIATLGKRILRCETAPMVAMAVIMQLTENMN